MGRGGRMRAVAFAVVSATVTGTFAYWLGTRKGAKASHMAARERQEREALAHNAALLRGDSTTSSGGAGGAGGARRSGEDRTGTGDGTVTRATAVEAAMDLVCEKLRTPFPTDAELDLLCARVTVGTCDDHFRCLQRNWNVKRNAFVLGGDGIKLLLGSDPWSALRTIGFSDDWIIDKLRRGFRFQVALFPARHARPATWDGVFAFLQDHYAPEIVAIVAKFMEQLRATPFEVIQQRAMQGFLRGDTYLQVNLAARNGVSSDERFIDETRLLAASPPTLELVRGYLFNQVGLTELFDGNGYTKDRDGARGVREFLCRGDVPVASIPGFRYVPLAISLPA